MSDSRKRDAATATLGLTGVAGAGALRHQALERAYAGGERPRMLQERRFFTRKKVPGRGKYAVGAGLALVSVPPAAVGTARLLGMKETTAKREKRTFLEEGVAGVKDSLSQRLDTAKNPAPAKLMAANYAGGAAIASAAGGLAHLALGRTRLAGTARAAALASGAGVATGAATLPAQSKLIERASHGRYEATPTGVRRRRTKAARPSSVATVVEGRPGRSTMHPHALREQMAPVGKMSPRTLVKAPARVYNDVGARVGAHWTVNGLRVADKVDVPQRAAIPKTKKGKLVYTGRTKAANMVRSAALDVGSLNDKDALARNTVHGHPLIGKSEYYGKDLTPGQKRARVMAAGATPILGDFAAAGAAAGMAPPELRKKTAALQFGGSQAGQVAGSAAGAYGLVAAAKHPKVKAGVERANDAVDAGTAAARAKLGLKPKTGPGALTRVAEHARTPGAVRTALRPLAKNPKVAAVGMLAGGMAGTQGGGFVGYGHALKLEQKRNAKSRDNRRGFSKRDARVLTSDEHRKQAKRKRTAANVATFTGLTGTSALAALGGSRVLRATGRVAHADRLASVQTPLLTAGAGVGGLGSFNFARMQRKEAKAEQAQVRKGMLVPRVPGIRRAPSMRRGGIRQTRYPSGMIRTSTVRGGLA